MLHRGMKPVDRIDMCDIPKCDDSERRTLACIVFYAKVLVFTTRKSVLVLVVAELGKALAVTCSQN